MPLTSNSLIEHEKRESLAVEFVHHTATVHPAVAHANQRMRTDVHVCGAMHRSPAVHFTLAAWAIFAVGSCQSMLRKTARCRCRRSAAPRIRSRSMRIS